MEEDFGTMYSFDDRLDTCPFCNEKACLGYIIFEDNDVWYNPQCSECSCGWNQNYETKEEAIKAWNKRNE